MNGVSRPKNAGRLLVIGSLVLVAVVSFGLTLALSNGEGSPSTTQKPSAAREPTTPAEPSGGFEMSEVYVFDSTAQMTATAELVATGTVTDVTVGRIIDEASGSGGTYPDPWNSTVEDTAVAPRLPPEEPEDDVSGDYPTRFLNTSVRVDEVLKGPAPATDTITVETLWHTAGRTSSGSGSPMPLPRRGESRDGACYCSCRRARRRVTNCTTP